MNFESLSLEQRIAVHELEIRALRQQLQRQEHLLAVIIDLLAMPANSPEFFMGLRALRAERERGPKEP